MRVGKHGHVDGTSVGVGFIGRCSRGRGSNCLVPFFPDNSVTVLLVGLLWDPILIYF